MPRKSLGDPKGIQEIPGDPYEILMDSLGNPQEIPRYTFFEIPRDPLESLWIPMGPYGSSAGIPWDPSGFQKERDAKGRDPFRNHFFEISM